MMRLIVPIIMLAVSIGMFFMYTSKTYSEIEALKVKEASYDQALDNAAELESVRNQLLEKYALFTPGSIEKLKKLLPNNVDNIKLILEINDRAARYNMSLKNVKFNTTDGKTNQNTTIEESSARLAEKNKDFNTFEVEFSTEGTYPNFVLFIKDIEQSLRIVDINSVAFSSPDVPATLGGVNPGRPRDVYKYDFKISTYWLKQ